MITYLEYPAAYRNLVTVAWKCFIYVSDYSLLSAQVCRVMMCLEKTTTMMINNGILIYTIK